VILGWRLWVRFPIGAGDYQVDRPLSSERVFAWHLLFMAIRRSTPEALEDLRECVLPAYSGVFEGYRPYPDQYESAEWIPDEIDPDWELVAHGEPYVDEDPNWLRSVPGESGNPPTGRVIVRPRQAVDGSCSGGPFWTALYSWAKCWNLAHGSALRKVVDIVASWHGQHGDKARRRLDVVTPLTWRSAFAPGRRGNDLEGAEAWDPFDETRERARDRIFAQMVAGMVVGGQSVTPEVSALLLATTDKHLNDIDCLAWQARIRRSAVKETTTHFEWLALNLVKRVPQAQIAEQFDVSLRIVQHEISALKRNLGISSRRGRPSS